MKREKVIDVLLLAICVTIFVSVWGTFHNFVGIKLAWVAFLSAAVFFAAGHKLKECITILLTHFFGVAWGLMVLYAMNQRYIEMNNTMYIFLVLAVFAFFSVIVTNSGIKWLSHLPSLFCGWAITFAIFGGIEISKWKETVPEVLIAIAVGVLFVGVGISQLHNLIMKYIVKPTGEGLVEAEKERKSNIGKPIKDINKSGIDKNMEKYICAYSSSSDKQNNEKEIVVSNIGELKDEIASLKQVIEDSRGNMMAPTQQGNINNAKVKIIGVCGSPHKKGSTIEYLKKALAAAEEMGNVETQIIELAGKELKPCMGCKSDKCGGTCRIDDYMQEVYPMLRECDGIILASPSYFGTFTGQLKVFLDRLRVMRHSDFELANKVIGSLAVAGRRHGGQEITNIDLIQAMMRHNTIIVNDGTAVCQLGATGWSHTFDDPTIKSEDDDYGMQTAVGVGKRVAEISKLVKASGLQKTVYSYNQKIGKR